MGLINISSSSQKPLQKRSRQLRLTAQEVHLTDSVIRDMVKSLDEMIVKDYQPLSIVEDKRFARLCKKLNLKYSLPSRNTLTTKLIPQHYSEIRSKLLDDLQNIDNISATTDYW